MPVIMPVIKRTCGTAIGGAVFISMLISGNNISTVEANGVIKNDTRVFHSDVTEICKTYTLQKGMNYSVTGYNVCEENKSGIENVIMNEEKMNNLKKLDQIASLKDGWNGDTAKAFDIQLISKVRSIITMLELQPEIFPTACESIQLEYEKEDGSYLEIEINSDEVWEIFEINKDREEKYSSIAANIEAVIKVVNSFYG